MKANKKKGGIYSFLEVSSVLENGSDTEIALARKTYWRQYKSLWRRAKRKKEKELTPSFNREEYSCIVYAARAHHRSCTRFIKEATLAYISKRYIIPDPLEVKRISQMLNMYYNELLSVIDDQHISSELGNILLEKVSSMEQALLVTLHNPTLLKDSVISHDSEKS